MRSIIIPTLNAGGCLPPLLGKLKEQSIKPDEILIIDSSSEDNTKMIAESFGARVIAVERKDFDHGGTRNLGVRYAKSDIIVFLTQDALPADEYAIENLIKPFCNDNQNIGATYGRQLPRQGSNPIEAYARLFNYPPASLIKTIADIPNLGIKTTFMSNAFAAYQRAALQSIGGFPVNTILGEETYVASKLLLSNWKIAYCADAKVYHSHNYSHIEEFQRYFDTGVFHSREPWIRQSFGQAEGEGIKYVLSELNFLWREKSMVIPSALLRTALKFIAYKLGLIEKRIPIELKIHLSMNKLYWK